ncbi:MAG: hypothetical protein F9K29_24815 [Hyphomicrobiaceae bacterium]|nr:MAG: hypothetical protein F9K29_24815 [Hyphomicrobiaceae bacterium]
MSQEQCLERARNRVRNAGFTKGFETVGSSVFGERGDYTVGVRCITEKGIVFIVVAGPEEPDCSRYRSNIIDDF